jgi:hypothetical protein
MNIVKSKISSSTVICYECNGLGTILDEECMDYHKGIYKTNFLPCHACNSTGRLIETIRVEYTPFVELKENNNENKS